jgi:hypothetical protein
VLSHRAQVTTMAVVPEYYYHKEKPVVCFQTVGKE